MVTSAIWSIPQWFFEGPKFLDLWSIVDGQNRGCYIQRVAFRPFCIDFCIDCMGLQSSKVNNNTAETA